MPRKLNEIIAHIRMVAANPNIDTTLIQTEDLELLCKAAEGGENNGLGRLRRAIVDNTQGDLFWIGEILLAELEKETGFKG